MSGPYPGLQSGYLCPGPRRPLPYPVQHGVQGKAYVADLAMALGALGFREEVGRQRPGRGQCLYLGHELVQGYEVIGLSGEEEDVLGHRSGAIAPSCGYSGEV